MLDELNTRLEKVEKDLEQIKADTEKESAAREETVPFYTHHIIEITEAKPREISRAQRV